MRPGPEGYRPGGINRNPFAGTYIRDILTNYELGWKTRFRGRPRAAERRDLPRGLGRHPGRVPGRQRHHAGGERRQGADQGIEAQLDWLPTDNLRLVCALAYYDSELKKRLLPGLGRLATTTATSRSAASTRTLARPDQGAAGRRLPLTPGLQGQPDCALLLPDGRSGVLCAGRIHVPDDAIVEPRSRRQ